MSTTDPESTVSPLASSRRGLLRLVGAGALTVAIGRASPVARAQTPYPTRLRILHASPALGKVEVHINGQEELDEFTYGMVSDWIQVDPGTARITIHRDRAGINYVVYDAYMAVTADEDYDFIIADPLISDPVIIPVQVDRSPLPANTGRLSAIHASVGLPAVDVARKGGDVLVENLQFGQLSAPLELPAGSVDLEVRAHETGDVVLDLAGTAIEAGKVYHLVVYGNPGSADTPVTSASLADDARPSAATPTA
jgi:hypothetical protein